MDKEKKSKIVGIIKTVIKVLGLVLGFLKNKEKKETTESTEK